MAELKEGDAVPLPKADPRGYAPRQKYAVDGSDVWPDQPTRKKSYYDEAFAFGRPVTGK